MRFAPNTRTHHSQLNSRTEKEALAMYSTLILEFSGEIARITLNRPDKRNAINPQMMCDLQTAFDTIEKSHSRVVILTGAGKCFCAGMDLDMLATIAQAIGGGESGRLAPHRQVASPHLEFSPPADRGREWRRVCRRLRNRDALRFHAGGAGSEIRLHRSENRLPACDRFRFLTRQIGEKRSRDLLLTGRIIDAAEATDYGLVTEVVPAESLLDRANALADELMAASPSSLTRAKHLLTSSAAASVDHDLERAILENARIRCTPDFKEGVASFLEKRKPIWQVSRT